MPSRNAGVCAATTHSYSIPAFLLHTGLQLLCFGGLFGIAASRLAAHHRRVWGEAEFPLGPQPIRFTKTLLTAFGFPNLVGSDRNQLGTIVIHEDLLGRSTDLPAPRAVHRPSSHEWVHAEFNTRQRHLFSACSLIGGWLVAACTSP